MAVMGFNPPLGGLGGKKKQRGSRGVRYLKPRGVTVLFFSPASPISSSTQPSGSDPSFGWS